MSQTTQALTTEGQQLLFTAARTHYAWLPKTVEDSTLRALYELFKWPPTSANANPGRILFVRSPGAKEKLLNCVAPPNVDKVKNAPVTAILAWDAKFFDAIPKLRPSRPEMREMFANNAAVAESTAFRNSSMQGGYFILAARAVGLDTGPMSGFDNAKVDAAFFSERPWRSNFLCNLGYGDPSKTFPRSPRLTFDEACAFI